MLSTLIRRLFRSEKPARAQIAPDSGRLRDAVALQQRGEWDAALAAYRELLAAAPDDPQLLQLMASALSGAGRRGEAIACYRRLLSGESAHATGAAASFPEARLALAGLLNADGDFDGAAKLAVSALEALAADPGKTRMAELARDEMRKAAIMCAPYPAQRTFRHAQGSMPVPGAVNVVYFHVAARVSPNATCEGVDYPELIALSAQTARRRMPEARVVLLSDEVTEFAGVAADRVIRLAADADNVVYERIRMQRAYVASNAFDADSILVDSDTVFHGDARPAFAREFDLAYTVRRGFELMPFNVGVVFMRLAARDSLLRYLDACLACFAHLERNPAVRERYPEGIRRWWGDQLVPAALVGWEHCAREIGRDGCDLAEIDGACIGLLPADTYNFDADAELAGDGALEGRRVLHFKGRRKDGMRRYVASLAGNAPGADAERLWQAGLALWDAGEHAAARAQLKQALALAPDEAAWWSETGLLCMSQDDDAAAEAAFRRALAIAPQLAEAHCNLGIVLQKRAGDIPVPEHQADALAHFQRAVAIRPGLVSAQFNCGLLLWQMARPEQAIPHFERALARDAALADGWRYRGYALQDLRRFDEAQQCFERALAIRPDYHEVRLALAYLHLLRGEFRAGWREYAARYATAESPLRAFPFPDWEGAPLDGRILLVYAEQGLGDEILFASCLPDLVAQAGHLVIECEPRLRKLFARSFPRATVHGGTRADDMRWLETVQAPEWKIAAGSVPGLLRNEWTDFPARDAYLVADPARVAYWRQRLDALGPGPKIGIAWRGGIPQTRAQLRSLPLAALLPPLQIPGMHFVSLQRGDTAAEREASASGHGVRVHDFHEAHADYDEMAALMMALDAVVSVCCSIVHLAGALGKTAWVLTPFVPEWRYLAQGDAMPWYRSVHLIRQTRRGEWAEVLERARDALLAQFGRAPELRAAADAATRRRSLEDRVTAVPDDADAHRALGELALAAGDFESAADCFELALHYRPGELDAMLGLARTLRETGRAAEAEALCRDALAQAPASISARHELASALKSQERFGEAVAEYRAALAMDPDDPALLCNCGYALYLDARYDEAAEVLRRALARNAEFAEAHHNLGLALRELGDIGAALSEFRIALSLRDLPATRSAMGHALRDLGSFDEALAQYETVLAAHPDDGDVLLNRAHALLMRGDWARGWDAYERRFAAGGFALRPFPLPRWEGGSADGKGVLAFGEQGLGDEIMFASCIPMLLAREAGCVIECNARLAPLFARSFAVPVHGGSKQDSTGWIGDHPGLGWQIPVGSLPRVYLRDSAEFEKMRRGYLRADESRVAAWSSQFSALRAQDENGAAPGLTVGLSWRGGSARTRGGLRSMELAELALALAVQGCRFVSLQHGDAAAEPGAFCRSHDLRIASWPETGDDLDELAAMIMALDLVISIDNTTAHLAGALGKPVWILLAQGAEWRYGTDPVRMPWYPGATLFRQTGTAEKWTGVVSRVASALKELVDSVNARRA